MVLPIGIEDNMVGVVDLLSRKAWVWDDSGEPENYEIQDVPADMVDDVEKYRAELIETAVEQDDDLMMEYLDGNEPSIEDIKKCVRKGTIALDFFPTYCGSAFKNKGVQVLLDAIVDYLPSPTEVPPQPEVDPEGNETGEFAIVTADARSVLLPSRSWTTSMAPLLSLVSTPVSSKKVLPSSTPSPAKLNVSVVSLK